ncbi:WW domain-containing protein [Entamoeba marina]
MSNITITPHIINYGYSIGSRIEGYIDLFTTKRIILTHLHFNINGVVVLSENSSDKKAHKTSHSIFTSRSYFPVPEQFISATEPYHHEYFPGHHNIPFSIIIPVVPYPSIQLENNVGIHYYLKTTLTILPLKIKSDVVSSITNCTFTNMLEIPILFCINDVDDNHLVEETLNLHDIIITLSSKSSYKLGEPIQIQVNINNNTTTSIEPIIHWHSQHIYHSTHTTSPPNLKTMDLIQPKSKIQKEFTLDSTQLFPTISIDDFMVETNIVVSIDIPKQPRLSVSLPIYIGWEKGNEKYMKVRATQSGFEYTDQIYLYYGSHLRPPPNEIQIVEEFDNDGKKVFVNNQRRKCYADKECTEFLNIRYPLPECCVLPKGWGIGIDRNELYFINYIKDYTTWIDPRTFSQRKCQVKSIVITLLHGKNFPMIKGKVSSFKAVVYNKSFERIKSGISTKDIDPQWNDNNELLIDNDPFKENLVIGFYSGKCFVGAVDIPLWRIVKNGIIQWFQLRNFGRFYFLLKLRWKNDVLPELPDPFNYHFTPYYCNSDLTKEVEKQLNKYKSKLHQPLINFTLTENGCTMDKFQEGMALNYNVDGIGIKDLSESFDEPEIVEEIIVGGDYSINNSTTISGGDEFNKEVDGNENQHNVQGHCIEFNETNENSNHLKTEHKKSGEVKEFDVSTINNKNKEDESEDDEMNQILTILEQAKKDEIQRKVLKEKKKKMESQEATRYDLDNSFESSKQLSLTDDDSFDLAIEKHQQKQHIDQQKILHQIHLQSASKYDFNNANPSSNHVQNPLTNNQQLNRSGQSLYAENGCIGLDLTPSEKEVLGL